MLREADHSPFYIGGSTGEPDGDEVTLAGDLAANLELRDLTKPDGSLFVVETEAKGQQVLTCGTSFGKGVNGAIVLWRDEKASTWTEEDRQLLHHIASHMGIALAQAAHAEALEKLSREDSLTGLLNRRAFFEDAEGCLARNERNGHSATYVYFDLDNFKAVNDTLGHAAGDKLIVAFADILIDIKRRGDLAVRLGGDEFGLFLDDCGERDATAKAETIAKALADVVSEMELPPEVSVSAGIAVWRPGAGLKIADVLERADAVLYDVKRSRKHAWKLSQSTETPVGDYE